MNSQIVLSFKVETDLELVGTAHRIHGKMTGNPHFPTPPVALGTLGKEIPVFQDSITKASGGDEEMRFIKKDKRAVVIGLISELVEYVTLTCNGDPGMIVSSGFKLRRQRGEKALVAIKELKVAIERPGEAVTRVKKVAGAKAYIHQYTQDPLAGDSVWINKCTTDSSYTFTGLKSKEKYWFQVIAIGLNGQEEFSPPVSRVIQ